MIRVKFSKSAEKDLLKLPKDIQKLVAKKLLILSVSPLSGKPLSGKLKGIFSVRVWPYRILYEFFPKTKIVIIHKISHRQGVYKK